MKYYVVSLSGWPIKNSGVFRKSMGDKYRSIVSGITTNKKKALNIARCIERKARKRYDMHDFSVDVNEVRKLNEFI